MGWEGPHCTFTASVYGLKGHNEYNPSLTEQLGKDDLVTFTCTTTLNDHLSMIYDRCSDHLMRNLEVLIGSWNKEYPQRCAKLCHGVHGKGHPGFLPGCLLWIELKNDCKHKKLAFTIVK